MTEFDATYDFIDIHSLSEDDIRRTLLSMTPQKRRRVESFRHYDDMLRSAAAEYLARKLISGLLNVPESSVLIEQLESGQPAVAGLPCFVSLSHSGNLAMAAVSRRPIGADIEMVSDRGQRLLTRTCTPAEQEYILASGSFDPKRFFSVWTAKEALLKHCGKGLSGGISSTETANRNGMLTVINGLQLISGFHSGAAFAVCT